MPLLGNLHRITFLETSRAFSAFSRLSFAGKPGVFVTSPDLVAELSDARRFRKVISGGLYFVRALPPGARTIKPKDGNVIKARKKLLLRYRRRFDRMVQQFWKEFERDMGRLDQ